MKNLNLATTAEIKTVLKALDYYREPFITADNMNGYDELAIIARCTLAIEMLRNNLAISNELQIFIADIINGVAAVWFEMVEDMLAADSNYLDASYILRGMAETIKDLLQ